MNWTRGCTVGQGSSATVSIATSRHSGAVFAVKSAELSTSEFLQREQQILSSLDHPQIVSYKGYDVTRENNKVVYNLFMEYVAGGTIVDAIRRNGGKLCESLLGCYTRQVLQGLDYLHSQGIVHCDIKPHNILISQGGAKIADFGCSKRITPQPEQGLKIAGTPMYMAPEVARGEEQGFAADVWALGCAVIEMATGESPWSDQADAVNVLYGITCSGALPEFPSNLSDKARDFLSKCINRDMNKRWTSRQLLEHPFLKEIKFSQEHGPSSNSPTSILDQEYWNSLEESSGTYSSSFVHTSQLDDDDVADRITRLTCYEADGFTWDGGHWITVRDQNNNNMINDELCNSRCLKQNGSGLDMEKINAVDVEDGVGSDSLLGLVLGKNMCGNISGSSCSVVLWRDY